jgi:diguanylate cyclase (GGDEF)-like protein
MRRPKDLSTSGIGALVFFVELLAIIIGTYVLVESTVALLLENASPVQQHLGEGSTTAILGGALAWALVVRPVDRRLKDERATTALREGELRSEAQRQDFGNRLHRALDMAGTETAAHSIMRRTLKRALPEHPAELLLADSSDAHLKSAAQSGPEGIGPGCPVQSPHDCPAIRRGQTLLFASSEEIDACPHLQERPYGPCSAICVPVNVAGRSIGVLHVAGPHNVPAQAEQVERLEILATQGGSRLGMLRVMERTSLQAATDPLTGLINRRTLEKSAHQLLLSGEVCAVAMGDLDHFKLINDTHGHEAGDRALRLFAHVLRSSVRTGDLVCRFGGEEFAVVFPHQSAAEAAAVLGRTQEDLLVSIAKANSPSFTVSYGVTDSHQADTLEDLLRIADLNLFRAKRDGRNRISMDEGTGANAAKVIRRQQLHPAAVDVLDTAGA